MIWVDFVIISTCRVVQLNRAWVILQVANLGLGCIGGRIKIHYKDYMCPDES